MRVLRAADAEQLPNEFFWLDLADAEAFEPVARRLGLHGAAVEDTREWGQLPKVDDYGDHVLLVFFSARVAETGAEPVEVHVYISGDWIVTVHRCPTPLDQLAERLDDAELPDKDEIVYLVLDALMDGWDPVVAALDGWVDELEEAVFARVRRRQLSAAYYLKQQVNDLVRHVAPQRARYPAAVATMEAVPGISQGSHEWLRDVQAHLDITASDLQRIQHDLTDLTQSFFNANANRLNQTATRISVLGVFFLFWTLVTGFFGQNFAFLTDGIASRTAFLVYGLGALVVPSVIIGIVLWRRRGDWW